MTKYYVINLQVVEDYDRKFVGWSMRSTGSTHGRLKWGTTALAIVLQEFGLPPGFWTAGDDAYPTSEYLVSP